MIAPAVSEPLRTVAALYVDPRGPYPKMPGVECWDEARDARLYDGPHPVVAHPPCERWGRYWGGGPMLHGTPRQKIKGDDGGCFASALVAVRRFGGVLEHPEASHAWTAHGIAKPPKSGGWIESAGGWTCCVEQGHYGHSARKATWLFCSRVALSDPIFGPSKGQRLEPGFHSREERALASIEQRLVKRISFTDRLHTPPLFAEWLVALARTVK